MLRLSVVMGVTLWASSAGAALAPDPFVPGAGRFGLSLATGVPFLVMSEVSLGITDYGALGVLGGTTPIVSGFGIRPRVSAPLGPSFRLLLSAPLVFYPPHDRSDAWWLTRPSLSLDTQPFEGVHVAAGAGIVSVAAQHDLFGERTPGAPSPYATSGSGSVDGRKTWWTLNLVATRSVSTRSHVFLDATGVFEKLGLAGVDWIGGPPFILFLGVSTAI